MTELPLCGLHIAIVIAAYNEADNLGPLTSRLIAVMDSLPGVRWTIYFVVEGTDGSAAALEAYARERPEIRILDGGSVPSGLGCAFRRGFQALPPDVDLVATMDADLNHQPEELPRLIESLIHCEADVVVGSRRLPASEILGMPAWKLGLSRMVTAGLRALVRIPVLDVTSGFRVYRACALQRIRFQNNGFAFLPEILIDAASKKLRIVEQPICFTRRLAGRSKMAILTTGLSYLRLFARYSLVQERLLWKFRDSRNYDL